jgi:LemA protein
MWLLWIIILLAIWVIWMFNGLVVLKNRADEAASDIDVQLKRRHDLVPNLVNTVKGYATHEDQLFTKVTEARAQAVAAGSDMKARAQAENQLTGTLRSLFAVAENYPELKANQNFLALQSELSDTENKIMAARRFYNANVRDYNIRRETFPTNLLADYFKFGKRELFELDDITDKAVPTVDFNPTPTPPTPPVAEMAHMPAPEQAPEELHPQAPAPQPEYHAEIPEPTPSPMPEHHEPAMPEQSEPSGENQDHSEGDNTHQI